MIYFDNAATSLIKPDIVKREVVKALDLYTANPGRSGHKLSQKVAIKVFETRENVKKFFNAQNYSVIFTKNCTEALNLAIFGSLKPGDHVITTCYEHNSVLRPLNKLKSQGVDVEIVEDEMSNMFEQIKAKIKTNTKMIITNMVSNVTGEVCDVAGIGELCKQNKIIYLVDGAQACGHMLIDLQNTNIDMLSFAGHKGLMSIAGVGGLVVKNDITLMPLMYGGTGTESENLNQPIDSVEGFEAGTLSTVSIVSLNAGIEFLNENLKKILKIEQKLSNYLYFQLKKLKFLKIYSNSNSQNVFAFNVKNLDSSEVANILNEKFGICVRSGLHCAPLIHKKLKTLEVGAVRVSLDFYNTFEEIDYLIYALKEIANV